MDKNRIGKVYSSHGEFEICLGSGVVMGLSLDNPEDEKSRHLTDITRFDLREFKKYWELADDDDVPKSFDILDLGYYCKDGTYEPPVEEHRIRIKDGMGSMIADKVAPLPEKQIKLGFDSVRNRLVAMLRETEDPDELAHLAEEFTGAELEWDAEEDIFIIKAGEDYCGAFEGL
jgi:hypothetical protein